MLLIIWWPAWRSQFQLGSSAVWELCKAWIFAQVWFVPKYNILLFIYLFFSSMSGHLLIPMRQSSSVNSFKTKSSVACFYATSLLSRHHNLPRWCPSTSRTSNSGLRSSDTRYTIHFKHAVVVWVMLKSNTVVFSRKCAMYIQLIIWFKTKSLPSSTATCSHALHQKSRSVYHSMWPRRSLQNLMDLMCLELHRYIHKMHYMLKVVNIAFISCRRLFSSTCLHAGKSTRTLPVATTLQKRLTLLWTSLSDKSLKH